jgi:hypothetical protein
VRDAAIALGHVWRGKAAVGVAGGRLRGLVEQPAERLCEVNPVYGAVLADVDVVEETLVDVPPDGWRSRRVLEA